MKVLAERLALLGLLAMTGCGKSGLWNQEDFTNSGAFPYAVKILDPVNDQLCSGVVLSDRAVLTAAHCARQEVRRVILSSVGVVTARERILGGTGNMNDTMDLAILLPGDPIVLSRYPRLGSKLGAGEKLQVVGFGCNAWGEKETVGTLSIGENTIDRLSNFIYLVTPSGPARGILGGANGSGLCYGDSGAPALRAAVADELVGLGHGVTRDATHHHSTFIDLTQIEQQQFLRAENERHDLGIQFEI